MAPVLLCTALLLSLTLSAVTASAEISNQPRTASFTLDGSPMIQAGQSLTLAVEVLPVLDGPYTYKWTIGSRPTGGGRITDSGSNTSELTITVPEGHRDGSPDLQISLAVMNQSGNPVPLPDLVVPTVGVIPNVNDAPTISGTPATSVAQDAAYSFTPTGNDADAGDTLTYTIVKQPSWATFSTTTGALTGTPDNDDVGTTSGIVIAVSDGTLSASLPAFDITVTNVNDAPTANAGTDQTVNEGDTVILDGSGTDIDADDTLTYAWTQTDGTTVTLSDATAASPTFTAPTRQTDNGALVFKLTVTDARGQTATDTVTITVTSDVSVQKTVESINRFMHTRTNLILANQPKLSRRINRLQRGVGSEQLSFATGEITKLKPFEFNFLSLGSGTYKFATSLDQVTRAADHLQVTKGGTAYHESRRFDVWFEGSLNKFNGSAGSNGDFAIAYLGADYLVSPDLLVGGLLQYDSLTSSAAKENTEGKGWMAGPYVTARLTDNLYLDARLAWGLGVSLDMEF